MQQENEITVRNKSNSALPPNSTFPHSSERAKSFIDTEKIQ